MIDLSSQNELVTSPTSLQLAHSFSELALELSQIGASIEIPIRPFVSRNLPHFAKLSVHDQQVAVSKLAQYVAICKDVMINGGDLRSTRTFVWRAFREFGLTPNASLFDSMTEDHVVEIYDLNNIQIFRNFRFFEFCSYTLEDVYTRPWTELFIRKDEAQSERLLAFAKKLVASNSRDTFFPDAGLQNTHEADSELRYQVDLEVEASALLFNERSEPVALVVCERAQLVSH